MARLLRSFFARPTLDVARALLGQRLVRLRSSERLEGLIVEAEAYVGQDDLACHARAGPTARNHVMFGPPGHAYVYFTYGMHWLLNCVTGMEGYPAAVLIRSIFPTENIEAIARRRYPAKEKDWCNGPAKLTLAFGIGKQNNGMNICDKKSPLFIEQAESIPENFVRTSARVGISSVPEPWRSVPWRYQAILPANWLETRSPIKSQVMV
jgi:DNA-3-methyladenine glycosylase